MKKIIGISAIIAAITTVYAQNMHTSPFFRFFVSIQAILNQVILILMGLAMVFFFYGLSVFVWKAKEEGEGLEKSKKFMMYSLGAIFVLLCIWGIFALLQNT